MNFEYARGISRLALALTALFLLGQQEAPAADLRANELSSLCAKRKDSPESLICSTYLKGVADGVLTAQMVARAMDDLG